MLIDEFERYSRILNGLTVDFVRAVPDDKWDFTPAPPGTSGLSPAPYRPEALEPIRAIAQELDVEPALPP